ncbi:MAG: hypothetical protein K0U36_05710 [Alphaproteobacteria bacterium]|nr:hypothetical protein [Alphaproteobacteria bacterium]
MYIKNFKLTLIKLLIVLLPALTVAYLTEKVVYVLPILAALAVVATQLRDHADDNDDEAPLLRVDGDMGDDAGNTGSAGIDGGVT